MRVACAARLFVRGEPLGPLPVRQAARSGVYRLYATAALDPRAPLLEQCDVFPARLLLNDTYAIDFDLVFFCRGNKRAKLHNHPYSAVQHANEGDSVPDAVCD